MSCLALTFFWDFLRSQGLDRAPLMQGLPYTVEWLDDRTNWIDYGTFTELERRVGGLFPERNELFYDIGLTFAATRGLGFMRIIMRGLLSPANVYARFPAAVPRFLFPFLQMRFSEGENGVMHFHYTFAAECPPSTPFLDTARGILSGVPMMLGAPPARVTMTRTGPLDVRFDVVTSQWTGLVGRITSFFRGIRAVIRMRVENAADASAELFETNRILQEKVDALTTATKALDDRINDLTALNQLARAVSGQLDLRSLLRSSTEAISDNLGETPVVLLLAEGEPLGLVPTAQCRVSRAELRELASLPWDAPLTRQLSEGPMEVELAGRRWATHPMRNADRMVGVLLVGAQAGTSTPALLESMAGQLAVSVENARSYKLVAELRDSLELRVRERTAELEEARTSLQDTVARLEQTDRAKRNFFANVSHELRTPLTLMLGPLEDVQSQLVDGRIDGAAEQLHMAHRNAVILDRLVGELLDFARLDAGVLPLDKHDLDLVELAGDVVETLRPLADRKRLMLVADLPAQAIPVNGDTAMLRRVVVNLVVNAVKYVRSGDQITVRASTEAGQALVEVEDTGPGIHPKDHVRIFERFERVNTDPNITGAGIGLAMVSDIVRAHGGSIELESEPERGALFRVRLPLSDAELAPPTVRLPPPALPEFGDSVDLDIPEPLALPGVVERPVAAPRGRVVVVEDNPEMRGFVMSVLGRTYDVTAFEDGSAAIGHIRHQLPDVVVSDVMMAPMDGLELARRLKADIQTRGIPVVLLSARHGSEAVLAGFAAGADDYVTKPFSPPELIARVGAQIRIRTLATTLLRMEKQYSLGVLSAGIAHEMLNPVNAVVNAVTPLRRTIDRMGVSGTREATQAAALLEAVEASGRRMHSVVRGILAYTRQDPAPKPTAGRLSEDVASVLTILRYRLTNVTIHEDYAWDDPVVHYPEWVNQVILNLLANALDAIADTGDIWISLHRDEEHAVLRIRDSGPGVPRELRERIFDPFFTTKPPGKGTGLGLAITREVAALHRGRVELLSGDGGAEFAVTIPLEPTFAELGSEAS